MTEPQKIICPPGLVAFTTWGMLRVETAASLTELVRFNERNGLKDIVYSYVSGALVDKARDEAVKQLLSTQMGSVPLGWIWFCDSDMSFAPNILDQLLVAAYQLTPWADAVGAWCPLRGKPYLPTIDRGSGTWEPVDANTGPVEVIRTGGACILVKRHVYEQMQYPWYKVRPAPRPLDVIAEMDNYARIKMDGTNPLRESPAWAALEKCAVEDAAHQRAQAPRGGRQEFMSAVGEDSCFADKMKALGFRIVVQTDCVAGHVDTFVIGPEQHREAMQEIRRNQRLVAGVLA